MRKRDRRVAEERVLPIGLTVFLGEPPIFGTEMGGFLWCRLSPKVREDEMPD
jgi:hypothetical protein